MKGQLGNMMQQVQKLQQNMQQAQQELANLEATGESGGGMVKVTLTGQHEAKRVQIDPSLLDDVEMLEDLVAAAINAAAKSVREAGQEKMSQAAGGMPIPPGLSGLFG